MAIKSFYTTSFAVKRQEWNNNKSSLVTKDSFDGHFQQAGAEVVQQYQGLRHTDAWSIWCDPDTDVEEGDRIVSDSVEYDVRFIQNRDVGNDGHLLLIVEKNNG